MSLTAQTQLEAVNIILASVGEDPVSALGGDASGNAEACLDEVSREIQEKGWHFNTESDYEMSIAGDGSVTLPANVAQFDLDNSSQFDVVMRGNRLYDKKSRSYTSFGTGVLVGEVVFIFDWDELPPTARRYFAMRAADRYQKRWFSSETLRGFTEQEMRDARLLFEETEARQADLTIFDNYSVARTINRSGSEFI